MCLNAVSKAFGFKKIVEECTIRPPLPTGLYEILLLKNPYTATYTHLKKKDKEKHQSDIKYCNMSSSSCTTTYSSLIHEVPQFQT